MCIHTHIDIYVIYVNLVTLLYIFEFLLDVRTLRHIDQLGMSLKGGLPNVGAGS